MEREKIIEALQTIKNTCNEFKHCNSCPLGCGYGCIVNDKSPNTWEITQDHIWRAVK